MMQPTPIHPAFPRLLELACEMFHITPAELEIRRTPRRIDEARGAIYLLAHEALGMTKCATARAMRRDHAAVVKGVVSTRRRVAVDQDFRQMVEFLRTRLLKQLEMQAA